MPPSLEKKQILMRYLDQAAAEPVGLVLTLPDMRAAHLFRIQLTQTAKDGNYNLSVLLKGCEVWITKPIPEIHRAAREPVAQQMKDFLDASEE